ncbi:catalase-related domain-containing protein [Bacillus sp. OV322]|uniref:catalase-related domain-containing protein n=1 Tax=Bacillus sp. OV322 TaxID=1882764 RepID=UPI0035272231
MDRRKDFKQAGETYNKFEEREKDELISYLVSTLAPCDKRKQSKIIEYCTNADREYGSKVEESIRNYSPENTSSQESIGAEGAEDAPENASKKGHEADPY